MNKQTTSKKKQITPTELSAKRRAASAKGLAARWGAARGKSKQVRVDASAYDALQAIPDKDRNRVASDAIKAAVKAYQMLGANTTD